MDTNRLGFPKKETEEMAKGLNLLLANYQIYYQNLRGLHWNIKGKRFFDLHVKFEELYNDSQLKIDAIAERILTLNAVPLHTFEDYLKSNQLRIGNNISKDTDAVLLVLDSLTQLLVIERDLLEKSGVINDEGTNAMMSDFIAEQEKTIWMFTAWLDE